jgi:hypothetical protein
VISELFFYKKNAPRAAGTCQLAGRSASLVSARAWCVGFAGELLLGGFSQQLFHGDGLVQDVVYRHGHVARSQTLLFPLPGIHRLAQCGVTEELGVPDLVHVQLALRGQPILSAQIRTALHERCREDHAADVDHVERILHEFALVRLRALADLQPLRLAGAHGGIRLHAVGGAAGPHGDAQNERADNVQRGKPVHGLSPLSSQ